MSTTTTTHTHAPVAARRPASRVQVRIGWALTGVIVTLLAMDAVTHLLRPAYVDDAMADLGWPLGTAPLIGALMAVGLVLHLVPRTRVIGALVVTGYLGGAVAAQVRIESPVAGTVFPVLVAAALWAGLCLRDPAVRRVILPSR